jgi:hypothetical protein
MNSDAVALRIALIDCFTVLILECPLPEPSQSIHHFANNKIADEIAGGRRLSGTPDKIPITHYQML